MRIAFHNVRHLLAAALTCMGYTLFAQDEWEEGELESVQIEIVKERQINLPPANRKFEKIPPLPAETIKAPMQYDFRPLSFQTAQIAPLLRPLRLKEIESARIFGGQVSAGYGNYASPYFEGFINSKRHKNRLVGAHAYLISSGEGPVDGRNSASGNSGVSLYGRSFSKHVSFDGDMEFENRSTHFYGYAPGTAVEADAIEQAYKTFSVSAGLSNTKNTAISYSLSAGFAYMADKLEARETEVSANFTSAYAMNPSSSIGINAAYAMLGRTDALVEATPRNLLNVNPHLVFYPVEGLRMSAGIVGAFENDTIDDRNVHAYPDIRVSYPLSPSVDVLGTLTGGIEKVSLQTLSRENLWLHANIPIYYTNRLYDLQAAVNSRVGNKVTVKGGFSFAALKNWYFFVNDSTDQAKFTTEYDTGPTLRTNFFASLGFVQAEAVKFMLRGDLYSYRTDQVVEAWHRPAYKVTADVSFNIKKKLLFDINMIAQGGVKAKKYLSPATFESVDLDAALDLNARMEYIVSETFSVFARANNIMSSPYPVFLNYPVRGFQMLGGISVMF